MANTALKEACRTAGFSEAGLAQAIRRYGFLNGSPNGCTREMVHRWCNGKTRRPQPHYVHALEAVLGQPAGNLGFDADLRHGVDRVALLSEAGLNAPMTLPDPAESYGPMSGVWLSTYSFTSSGRHADFTSSHYVVLLQTGAQLMIRSVPASPSGLSMSLTRNGQVITGTWTEQTNPDGWYRGAVYTGAIQMLERDPGRLWDGRWLGFGKGGEINDGPWSLKLAEPKLSADTIKAWDLAV